MTHEEQRTCMTHFISRLFLWYYSFGRSLFVYGYTVNISAFSTLLSCHFVTSIPLRDETLRINGLYLLLASD